MDRKRFFCLSWKFPLLNLWCFWNNRFITGLSMLLLRISNITLTGCLFKEIFRLRNNQRFWAIYMTQYKPFPLISLSFHTFITHSLPPTLSTQCLGQRHIWNMYLVTFSLCLSNRYIAKYNTWIMSRKKRVTVNALKTQT